MSDQLAAIRAADVTWVICANAAEVRALDDERRRCVHPCLRGGKGGLLSNGTLSLALKHRIASTDLLRRNLPSALVFEDDATVPPDLWSQMHRYRSLPTDAAIFYVGVAIDRSRRTRAAARRYRSALSICGAELLNTVGRSVVR